MEMSESHARHPCVCHTCVFMCEATSVSLSLFIYLTLCMCRVVLVCLVFLPVLRTSAVGRAMVAHLETTYRRVAPQAPYCKCSGNSQFQSTPPARQHCPQELPLHHVSPVAHAVRSTFFQFPSDGEYHISFSFLRFPQPCLHVRFLFFFPPPPCAAFSSCSST